MFECWYNKFKIGFFSKIADENGLKIVQPKYSCLYSGILKLPTLVSVAQGIISFVTVLNFYSDYDGL